MRTDFLFDRLVCRLRSSKSQRGEPSTIPKHTKTRPRTPKKGQPSSGFLNDANSIVMNQPILVDIENQTQIIHNFVLGKPVLEHIASFANLGAAMDSSARFPPPSCHPGTRLKIGKRLFDWLINHQRQWNMIWLHGPAGTGASFFFSRSDDWNNPNTVIPSLVYQLAVGLPHYKSLVTTQFANDPALLLKTRRTQFKKLIVEPFSLLHIQGYRDPLLIILDGFDECEGEDAQRDIIELISELNQLKREFPLVWLICSRPEAHLKYLFSRADFSANWGREELTTDAESIADVDLYLRDGLAGIKDQFCDVTPLNWPSEIQFSELSHKASGHFAFASTTLRYIGDLNYAAPVARLDSLLSFLAGIRTDISNPLKALDALYTRILRDVPDEVLLVIKLILGFLIYERSGSSLRSAQAVCSFLYIDQAAFYRAFRRLHSVIDVPLPEVASHKLPFFYHGSFEDYLRDVSRSGQFFTSRQDFMLDFAKSCLSWYQTDLELFHTIDEREFDSSHKHEILPGLQWVSDDSKEEVSGQVAYNTQVWCWWVCSGAATWDEDLLSQLRRFDFRYIEKAEGLHTTWSRFVNRLWEADASSRIIRTEPQSDVDLRLLEYMKVMIEPIISSRPVIFPLDLGYNRAQGKYFLLGHGPKAIVCWSTGHGGFPWAALNCHEAPSKKQIDAHQALLVREGQ